MPKIELYGGPLSVGEKFALVGDGSSGWHGMSDAPRDGTVIEIRCTYCVAPWYGIYRWTDVVRFSDGTEIRSAPGWRHASDSTRGVADESYLSWRPYEGGVESYVDPTGGAQDGAEYWRTAIAVRSGRIARNVDEATRKPAARGWFWRWFLGK